MSFQLVYARGKSCLRRAGLGFDGVVFEAKTNGDNTFKISDNRAAMYSVPTVDIDHEGTSRPFLFVLFLTAQYSTTGCNAASEEVAPAFDGLSMATLGLPAVPVTGESTPQLPHLSQYLLKLLILVADAVENGPVRQVVTIQEEKYLVDVRQLVLVDICYGILTLLCA